MNFINRCEESFTGINNIFEIIHENILRGPIIEATYKFLANLESLFLVAMKEKESDAIMNDKARAIEKIRDAVLDLKKVFTIQANELIP